MTICWSDRRVILVYQMHGSLASQRTRRDHYKACARMIGILPVIVLEIQHQCLPICVILGQASQESVCMGQKAWGGLLCRRPRASLVDEAGVATCSFVACIALDLLGMFGYIHPTYIGH
jgi:hypothetical protein